MNDTKSKKFLLFIIIANIFIVSVGATFAYFAATTESNEDAVNLEAAFFELGLEEDTSLIKTKVIPSKEIYVDRGTIYRIDSDKEFIRPYEKNGEIISKNTVCIDDNLNEICSIYTFTILNPMTDYDLPVYVTIRPNINTFGNLAFKVVDADKNVIMEKTLMKQPGQTDDRLAVPLKNFKTLPKATKDPNTDEIIPSSATYSIILWIDEIDANQTAADAGKMFAGTINIMSGSENGTGITGVFSVVGVE